MCAGDAPGVRCAYDDRSCASTGVLSDDQRSVTGGPAFALWRSLYFTQLLSAKTKSSVMGDWVRTQYSGRDVWEPVLKRTAALLAQYSVGKPMGMRIGWHRRAMPSSTCDA